MWSLCAANSGQNTGGIDCDVVRGIPQQIVIGSAEFTPADYASIPNFRTVFTSKLLLATGTNDKLFPLPVITGTTDKTVAAKYGTSGYGLQVKMSGAKPGYEFDILAGTTLEKALVKFDGKIIPIFITDDTGLVWGIKSSNGNFKGSQHLITIDARGFGDANNVKYTKVSIAMVDEKDAVQNAAVIDADFSSSDLQGLVDCILFETAAHVVNVYKIGAKIPTAALNVSLNIYDRYAAQLAVGSLWVAKTGAGFTTTLAITSVAADVVNGGWTITFDSTAYTALSTGALIRLSLAAPNVLDAANITQLESIPLILIK